MTIYLITNSRAWPSEIGLLSILGSKSRLCERYDVASSNLLNSFSIVSSLSFGIFFERRKNLIKF